VSQYVRVASIASFALERGRSFPPSLAPLVVRTVPFFVGERKSGAQRSPTTEEQQPEGGCKCLLRKMGTKQEKKAPFFFFGLSNAVEDGLRPFFYSANIYYLSIIPE